MGNSVEYIVALTIDGDSKKIENFLLKGLYLG
jgi:hypothetical protein